MQGYKRAEIKAIVGMHAREGYTTPRTSVASAEDAAYAGERCQGDSYGKEISDRATNVLRLGGLSADEVTIMEGVFACGTRQARDCVVPFQSPLLYMLPAEAGPAPHLSTRADTQFRNASLLLPSVWSCVPVILLRAVHVSSRRRIGWDVDGRYSFQWAFACARLSFRQSSKFVGACVGTISPRLHFAPSPYRTKLCNKLRNHGVAGQKAAANLAH